MKRLVILIAFVALCCNATIAQNAVVSSPDGTLNLTFKTEETGNAGFDLAVDSQQILSIRDIGFLTREKPEKFSGGFRVVKVARFLCDSVWHRSWGENKSVREHYNGMIVSLRNRKGVEMDIEFRLFDDGLGYRYTYRTKRPTTATLLNETTRYRWHLDGTCWSIPTNFESYEFLYRQQPLSQTVDANTPLTIRLENGIYCALHEAALTTMPEMTFRNISIDTEIVFQPWLAPDNTGSGSVEEIRFPITTAWRTIQIGRRATDLVNSTLILNLNEPPSEQFDTTFLHPMKYIGIWWGMHLGVNDWAPTPRHGATTANALRYIDFAAENDIDAVLFEGWNQGWENWGGNQQFDYLKSAPDFDLDSVVGYAEQKHIRLIMHHETGGNIPYYNGQVDSAFAWCQNHGIHAVKTGYAGGFPDQQLHHSIYGVTHYNEIMQKAARYGIMLDVHEPIKPTGLCRTYPNLMTGEGVRGMEWNAWSQGNPPEHQVTLPFTRMLAGPIDYTPGIFDITYSCLNRYPLHKKWNQMDASECRVHTTLAKQCALWVILYSPMVMAADLIENYRGHPMFQFFRDYRADIDWSEALQGEPGEFVVIARRADSNYYLGAATNQEGRTVTVPLDFLPAGIAYKATIYGDAKDADYETNPTAYESPRRWFRRPIRSS